LSEGNLVYFKIVLILFELIYPKMKLIQC